ncbi:sigma-54 dependent transcriptional regulator [Aliamphritea ceti]|uniref:sigma-54 dependent transcriptional regulator n=1 Tax=Aliamphritea ceti TaxID=1524258 RepID=UPI0021C2D5AF|nr:sigma-54 dependent transcriptional regulator [Aliamphritea ceti]
MQLLYVDDDSALRESLSNGLNFAGIQCNSLDYVSWLQASSGTKDDVVAVLLGRCDHPIDINQLLEQRLPKKLPLIAVGSWAYRDTINEDVLQRFVGDIDANAGLAEIMQQLHLAQLFSHLSLQSDDAAQLMGTFSDLAGKSSAMNDIRSLMAQVASRDVSVMISGESGTGKEVVANCLHKVSDRAGGPFVPINCGAIPAELLESELFGHEKGAFTGAVSSRAGRFELANGGTLFLDEIGDMPLTMQVKLLRVLQEKCFERIGGTKTIDCDVRIIAASHKDLEAMIEAGEFREDLYYRLNVFPITMPALRDRLEDLPVLCELFIQRAEAQGFGRIRILPAVLESLCQYPWSGNVRELANLIERLTIMHPDSVIGIQELPEKFRFVSESEADLLMQQRFEADASERVSAEENVISGAGLPEAGMDMKAYLEGIEQTLIEQALDSTNNVVARAADKLQIRRTTLVEKMRKYGIQRK